MSGKQPGRKPAAPAKKKAAKKRVARSSSQSSNSNQPPVYRPERGISEKMPLAQRRLRDNNSSTSVTTPSVNRSNLHPDAANYVMCLSNPEGHEMVRIPDAFARPTAITRSKVVFELPVRFDDPVPANNGKFSVLARPHLGATDNSRNFKIAAVDSSGAGGWPTGRFDQQASYLQITGGTDLRIDPFFGQLTQPQPSFLSIAMGGGAVVSIPFGTAPTVSNFSYGLPFTYDNTTGNIALPPGQYIADVLVVNTTAPAAALAITVNAESTRFISHGNFSTAGSAADSQESSVIFTILPTPGGSAGWINFSNIGLTSSAATAYISPVFSTATPLSMDGGMCQQYRPVSMSLMASCTVPDLVNGGSIAAAWLPGDTARDDFFTNGSNAAVGQLQEFGPVARLAYAYSGPFRDGARTIYHPEDGDDIMLRSPSLVLQNAFPSLVISGQINVAGTTGLTTIAAVRIEVVTVYELQTNTLFLEQRSAMGSTAIVEQAWGVIAREPFATANGAHIEWLRKLWSKVKAGVGTAARFAWENREPILKLASAASHFL
jgi:hypothetical protein